MNATDMAAFQRERMLAHNVENRIFFHGGRGGMVRGQFVLPPTITGALSTSRFGNYMIDRSKVYITTDPFAALLYAVSVKDGDVYQVDPEGALLTHDLDCTEPNLSFECARARIKKIIRFSNAERAMALRGLIGELEGAKA